MHYCVDNPTGVRAIWEKIDEIFSRNSELKESIVFYEEGFDILPLTSTTITKDVYDRFIKFANNVTNFSKSVIDSNNENTYYVIGSNHLVNDLYRGVVLLGNNGFYQLYVSNIDDQYMIYWEIYIVDPTQATDIEIIENQTIQSIWDSI